MGFTAVPLPKIHRRFIALCFPSGHERYTTSELKLPTNHKRHRKRIVLGMLAQSAVVVLVMAFGWWGMTTLGSYSLQPMRYPTYVAGCPLADGLGKGSGGGGCSKEGVSHPISSRQPGVRVGGQAYGAERQRDDRLPPRTSENSPSRLLFVKRRC